MEPNLQLSILIPSVPRRLPKLTALVLSLEKQSDPRMEVLIFMDNFRRPLGSKRNALMAQARGKYLLHLDDDDALADDFARTILPVLENETSDLVHYDGKASLNGSPFFDVTTRIGAENTHPNHNPDGSFTNIVRTPWTWCCWRTDFARQFSFPDHHDGAEDAFFLRQALPKVMTSRKIDRALFFYRYDRMDSCFS